jgi:membrane-bound ClpP family serine protease
MTELFDAALGFWVARRGLPAEAIRSIALTTAARTLLWGGVAFTLFGLFALSSHEAAEFAIPVPVLESIEPSFLLVVLIVFGVGVTTFVATTRAWRRRFAPRRFHRCRRSSDGAPFRSEPANSEYAM